MCTAPIRHLEAAPSIEFAGMAQVGIPVSPTGRRRNLGTSDPPASARLGRGWVALISAGYLASETLAVTGFTPDSSLDFVMRGSGVRVT